MTEVLSPELQFHCFVLEGELPDCSLEARLHYNRAFWVAGVSKSGTKQGRPVDPTEIEKISGAGRWPMQHQAQGCQGDCTAGK